MLPIRGEKEIGLIPLFYAFAQQARRAENHGDRLARLLLVARDDCAQGAAEAARRMNVKRRSARSLLRHAWRERRKKE